MTMGRLYRGMDRATLDRAYDNTRAVADFPAVLADFRRRSAQLYARVGGRREVRYGERPRERFDWLSCGRAGAPRFVFIHGGYWQNCAKEDFAFVADGPLAAGFDVVLAEYTLAPEASMTQIVGEIARLLDRLSADRDGLGGAGRPLCLSGHSAGGHLSAVHRGHACVTSTLAISPLVDLEPISLSWLNDKLRLSEREIADYSPLFHVGKGAPTIVAVGAHELPELVRHADDYAHACAAAGEPVRRVHVPGRTHFSVLEELAQPDGALTRLLGAIVGGA
ncbi:alpha/beta hydrolase [Burkholderia pseudomallei]|uniref:alpha/beta hydrolase n=1 Tax=Burkholderia pseudomallei TaxID=28450 RepID=UPI0009B1C0ED|nr:alpha/beta hydrolase [Burkholderia pseudomallei]